MVHSLDHNIQWIKPQHLSTHFCRFINNISDKSLEDQILLHIHVCVLVTYLLCIYSIPIKISTFTPVFIKLIVIIKIYINLICHFMVSLNLKDCGIITDFHPLLIIILLYIIIT